MSHEPQIQARAAQPYVAIRRTVTMDGISGAVDEAFPELFGWLAGRPGAAGPSTISPIPPGSPTPRSGRLTSPT
jgi:hypothetical protein